jgi:predicted nucleic acid-binding protein
MLRFADGTETAVVGLSEIMADLYSEGRQANHETAQEIVNRLEANKNYIPSSYLTRKEFTYVLLKEYKEYIKVRNDNSPKQAPVPK